MSLGKLLYLVGLLIMTLLLVHEYQVDSKLDNLCHDVENTLQKSTPLHKGIGLETKMNIRRWSRGHKEPLRGILLSSISQIEIKIDAFVVYIDDLKCQLNMHEETDCDHISVGEVEEVFNRQGELLESIIGIYSRTINNDTIADITKLESEDIKNKVEAFKSYTKNYNLKSGKEIQLFSDIQKMSSSLLIVFLSSLQLEVEMVKTMAIKEFAMLMGGRSHRIIHFFPIYFGKNVHIVKEDSFSLSIGVGGTMSDLEQIEMTRNDLELEFDSYRSRIIDSFTFSGKRIDSLYVSACNYDSDVTLEGYNTFHYEVGHPSASIFLPQNHYFYIGVDNAFQISVTGIPNEKIKLKSLSKSCLISGKNGDYIAQVSEEGNVRIKVETLGESRTYNVSVIKAPDPVASLGENKGGEITRAELVRYHSLEAVIEGFDFDYSCAITGFDCVRMRNGEEPVLVGNKGEAFSDPLKELINQALSEDVYYYKNIRAVCSGDEEARAIASLIYEVE